MLGTRGRDPMEHCALPYNYLVIRAADKNEGLLRWCKGDFLEHRTLVRCIAHYMIGRTYAQCNQRDPEQTFNPNASHAKKPGRGEMFDSELERLDRHDNRCTGVNLYARRAGSPGCTPARSDHCSAPQECPIALYSAFPAPFSIDQRSRSAVGRV